MDKADEPVDVLLFAVGVVGRQDFIFDGFQVPNAEIKVPEDLVRTFPVRGAEELDRSCLGQPLQHFLAADGIPQAGCGCDSWRRRFAAVSSSQCEQGREALRVRAYASIRRKRVV